MAGKHGTSVQIPALNLVEVIWTPLLWAHTQENLSFRACNRRVTGLCDVSTYGSK